MKRIFIIFLAVFGFSFFAEAQEITPETVKRRLDRSDSRIEHDKHGERAKTWVDRGIVFQDVFDVNIQYLYFGMAQDELRLFMGDPNEQQTVETATGVRNILVYDNIEVYFENGELVGWQETEVIHENPLENAYSSFQRAIQIEEEGEDRGFFGNLFGGSQERRIMDAFPRLSGQFVSQAVLQYEDADYDKAYESFKLAVEVADSPFHEEPVDTGLVYNTGFVAQLAGKHQESVPYLERAKEMGYGGGTVYILLKEAYMEMDDLENAEQILQEGFQNYPDDNAVLTELVNFYLVVTEDADAAFEYLQIAIEQEPNNPTFYFAQGALYERMDEPEKAKESYEKSISIDPDYFDANYNMGVLFYNEAVRLLEAANEIMDNVEYEKARDAAYDVLREAIPYLERAHLSNPDHPNQEAVMDTLRIIYYRLGIEDKLEDMNRKLGRDPEDVTP